MLNLGACQLLPQNRYYYHKLYRCKNSCYNIDMIADINHSSTPNLRIAHRITSRGTLSVELLSFNSKILLHLSYSKNGISGSLTFHKSKLHIIYLNLLPNSVFKDPFHHFHSMFQQFNPRPEKS